MKYLRAIKEGVLWLPRKIKNCFSFLLNKAVKNYSAVCTGLGVSIFFMLLIFYIQLDNSAQKFDSLKDNYQLNLDMLTLQENLSKQSETVKFYEAITSIQKKQLEEASEVIKIQGNVLDKLIQRLKDLDEWPPNIQPIDPSRITRSEASYEEEISYLR